MSKRVAGFSVLEAVIVLAITGLALTIVFSIGSRASEMGFRLGRRVLDISDSEIATLGFHTVVSSMVAPSSSDAAPGEKYSPPSLVGDPQHLEAEAITDRKTTCGAEGELGLVKLTVQNAPARAVLYCQAGSGPSVPLLDLGKHTVSFSYSTDGETWTDTVTVHPGKPPGVDAEGFKRGVPKTVFVRLSSTDGAVTLVERAWSGRPKPPPFDASTL